MHSGHAKTLLSCCRYCGACWAFGTTSSLSDRLRISSQHRFPELVLSAQVLLNCGDAGTCHVSALCTVCCVKLPSVKSLMLYCTFLACKNLTHSGVSIVYRLVIAVQLCSLSKMGSIVNTRGLQSSLASLAQCTCSTLAVPWHTTCITAWHNEACKCIMQQLQHIPE